MKKLFGKILDQKYYLIYILIAAVITRIYFSFGHVFSDDAYFDYLAYTFYKFEFAKDYIGYPHTPLRINLIALTAFAFSVFGTNEFATMVFPFLFSMGNILLAYFFVKEISNNQNMALLSALIMALFPTDIAFATINFADSPAAFFINLGLYYLYKAYKNDSLKFSIISGICFFLSIQFKINILFIGLLLVIVWMYLAIRSKSITYYIPIALGIAGLNLIAEGLIYLILNGDFFYRFNQIELNSQYNINEFFRLGSTRGYFNDSDFWPAVFNRIFIENPKDVFLRRFYLFLPLLALYQSTIFIKNKKHVWLPIWFLGMALLFIGFTSSLNHYQPMILRLSWYMFPLFLPEVILSTFFIINLRKHLKRIAIILLLIGSLILTFHYSIYFNVDQLDKVKYFIKSNPTKTIYTDHFTKYSIDLIDGYPKPLRTKRITGDNFDFNTIQKGEWVLFQFEHIFELKEQNHSFPDFSILHSKKFKKVFESGKFQIYEKLDV